MTKSNSKDDLDEQQTDEDEAPADEADGDPPAALLRVIRAMVAAAGGGRQAEGR